MTICIAGKNDIATNVLRFVVQYYGPEQVVAVANRDDTGQPTWQHSLAATARLLGVRLLSLDETYALPELHFFSVEFDRILVPQRFKQAELYNIHFSLLPRYKGVYTAVWPILTGDTETGVTLHRIEKGIDTGPIIHQVVIPIKFYDTARDVYYACLARGYEVLREFIPQLVSSPAPGTPQPMSGSTYYGPNSIDYAQLTINLRQTAYQVHNAVRAFSFQEYQLPTILGRRVRASKPTTTPSYLKPGTLVTEDAEQFFVSTIDFDICLIKDYSLDLLRAIEQQNTAHVRELATQLPSLEIRTRQGWSPLMIAAYTNNLAICKILVEAGADVNATNKKGTTVLMYAKLAAAGNLDVALLIYLLQQGADATAVDASNTSVLDYALAEGNPSVVQCLKNWLAK